MLAPTMVQATMFALLTLWLRFADKKNRPKETCIIGTDGQKIGQLDSTIVARMADKSARSIKLFGMDGQ